MRISIQNEPEACDLPLPSYATSGAAGMDLYAAVIQTVTLAPGERCLISTGIRLAIPPGYEGQVRPRSGLALRHGVSLVNSPGTIDSDFRNVVGVLLINLGQEIFFIHRGDRIAQLVIAQVARVEWEEVVNGSLPVTVRGEGGFGSTGNSAIRENEHGISAAE